MGLQDKRSDGGGVRSSRTSAGEVWLGVQVADIISPKEGGVSIVSRGNTGLQTHFRRREAIAHGVEVDRRRSGRGKVFRNARPKDAIGRGAVTAVRHSVALCIRCVDREILRRSDAGEAVAADDPADVSGWLRRNR